MASESGEASAEHNAIAPGANVSAVRDYQLCVCGMSVQSGSFLAMPFLGGLVGVVKA